MPEPTPTEREISGFVERLNPAQCDGIDCPYHEGQRAVVAEIIAATWRAAAEVAGTCKLSRPYMEDGLLKDEWESGVADASISIEAALLANAEAVEKGKING